jgi:hypothetical protein
VLLISILVLSIQKIPYNWYPKPFLLTHRFLLSHFIPNFFFPWPTVLVSLTWPSPSKNVKTPFFSNKPVPLPSNNSNSTIILPCSSRLPISRRCSSTLSPPKAAFHWSAFLWWIPRDLIWKTPLTILCSFLDVLIPVSRRLKDVMARMIAAWIGIFHRHLGMMARSIRRTSSSVVRMPITSITGMTVFSRPIP